MRLLPNEEIIISSNGNRIVLTNQRIIREEKIWGRSSNMSIFLENISSIETTYKSNTLFFVAGALFAGIGFFTFVGGDPEMGPAALVLGGILIAIWWFTRKYFVTISSNGGGHLKFVAEQMPDDQIESFITSVQSAKLNRVNQLFKIS